MLKSSLPALTCGFRELMYNNLNTAFFSSAKRPLVGIGYIDMRAAIFSMRSHGNVRSLYNVRLGPFFLNDILLNTDVDFLLKKHEKMCQLVFFGC